MAAMNGFLTLAMVPFFLGADRGDTLHLDASDVRPTTGVAAQFQGSLWLGKVGEDAILGLEISSTIIHRRWRLAPRIPLRLRVADSVPAHSMVLRMEDWDELSDFARLLPLAQYGNPGDEIFARYGELRGLSVGHGTMVYRFHNNAELSTAHGGLYMRGDWDVIGAEAMVDDVLAPSLAVLRTFSRPVSRMNSLPAQVRGLRFGLTLGADFRAPTSLQIAQQSIPEPGHYVARTREQDILPLIGADLEFPIWDTSTFQLLPYVDLNSVDLGGVGVHAGLRTNVVFSPGTRWTTKAEFHYATPGYQPRYVSPFYQIERLSYRGGLTKLAWLRDEGSGTLDRDRYGFSVESELSFPGRMKFFVAFADEEGSNNSDLMLRFTLPEIHGLRASLSYVRLGFGDVEDLIDPANTVLATSARYHIGEYFYVAARMVNEWWLNQEPDRTKDYATTLNYDVGVGALLQL